MSGHRNLSHFLQSGDLPGKLFPGNWNNCIVIEPPLNSHLKSLLLYKVSPYIICLVTLTNVLICIVLTRPSMISPTNIILIGIALSDMLTGLLPLPIYITHYFHPTYGNIEETSLATIYINHILTIFLPTVFHTTSIWFTLMLAFQRVIYVKFSNHVSRICTNGIALKMLILTPLFAIIFHSPNLAVSFSIEENPASKRTVYRCSNSPDILNAVHSIIRILLVHIVPCCCLTILTNIILFVLRAKHRLRQSLLNQSSTVISKNLELSHSPGYNIVVKRENSVGRQFRTTHGSRTIDTLSTSKMLLTVLLSFLMVEIPMGAVISAYTLIRLTGMKMDVTMWLTVTDLCNFIILVSYPINFFIYCGMSQTFRLTFCHLVNCRRFAGDLP